MNTMKVPDSPTLYTTKYNSLAGVDYSCDKTEVSSKRTPTGLNMISNDGGNPKKRVGWRYYIQNSISSESKLLDWFFIDDKENNKFYLYRFFTNNQGTFMFSTFNRTTKAIISTETKQVSGTTQSFTKVSHFMFDETLYMWITCEDKTHLILTTSKTGEIKSPDTYVPETVYGRNPDGSGGTSYEAVNLLSSKMTISFLGNSSDTTYWLFPQTTITAEEKYQNIDPSSLVVEAKNSSGKWVEQTVTTYTKLSNVSYLDEDGILRNDGNTIQPKITFSAAMPPIVTGQDNVRVTFRLFNGERDSSGCYQGYYNKARTDLLESTINKTYGDGADNRIFAVDGVNPNKIYYSDIENPTYFPDTNYITVGHESSGIKCLLRYDSYLAAVKGESMYESALYLISPSTNTLVGNYFMVKQTSSTVGAVSSKASGSLIDEPLFLTKQGLYAVTNNYLNSESNVKNRSYMVDKKLLSEPNLENACAISCRRYFLVAVNNHCYVFDGRKKSVDPRNNTDFLYEAYYWDNIPAVEFRTFDDECYFADSTGNICKFNTDIEGFSAYHDGTNTAIVSEWATPLDGDNKPHYFKTLNKKGCLVTMTPFAHTSCKVYLVRDEEERIYIGEFKENTFNWAEINFESIPFSSNDTVRDGFFKRKLKKYKRLQIIITNENTDEPFELVEIIKTYTVNNFAKNRG